MMFASVRLQLLIREGHYQAAEHQLAAAKTISQQLGGSLEDAELQLREGELLQLTGRSAAADAVFTATVGQAQNISQVMAGQQAQCALARLRAATGDWMASRALATEVLPALRSGRQWPLACQVMALAGLAQIHSGDHESGLLELRRARWLARKLRAPWLLLRVMRDRAGAELAVHGVSAAIPWLEKGLTMAQRMGARDILWRTAAQLARLRRQTGDDEQAETLMAMARDTLVPLLEPLTDANIHAAFLAQPDAADVLRC